MLQTFVLRGPIQPPVGEISSISVCGTNSICSLGGDLVWPRVRDELGLGTFSHHQFQIQNGEQLSGSSRLPEIRVTGDVQFWDAHRHSPTGKTAKPNNCTQRQVQMLFEKHSAFQVEVDPSMTDPDWKDTLKC